MVTEAGLRAATDRESGDPFLTCIEISGAGIPTPLRFVMNDEDIISNGLTYNRSGFRYKAPAQGDSIASAGRLRIDNVDRVLSQAVMGLSEDPQVIIFEILKSDPDTAQMLFPPFRFFGIGWDIFVMEGTLGVPDDQDEPAVSLNMDPTEAPGLFS